MSNFVIWAYPLVANSATLADCKGLNDAYKIHDGESLTTLDSKDIYFFMNPEWPESIILIDNLLNQNALTIVSERLKTFIAGLDIGFIEFCPINIINHAGEKTDSQYYLMQAIELVDCLDKKNSDFRFSRIAEDDICRLRKLVIVESAIPHNRPVFRMKHFGRVLFFRRDIAEQLSAAGFTGVGWTEIEKYKY